MNAAEKVLDAVGRLFEVLVGLFGRAGAVLIVLGAVAVFFLWRWFALRAAERGWREALAEKERSIQRLADIERGYRVEALHRQGLSLAQAERIVLGAGTPSTAVPVTAPKPRPRWAIWRRP